ncbi:MAG: hypothetical protein MJZ53_01320 [Paludibacteraceae bacterium]|nr:hypothetical protein [Paludibacteraceae bacterium]
MLLIGLRKGGVKCSSACPFYTDSGKVSGFNGPLKTHCRMTMHPWMADCDQYDPCRIDTVEVTEEQWKAMLASVKKKAHRQRKLYPEEHAEIHAVGCEWTRSKGRFNADKSATAHVNLLMC